MSKKTVILTASIVIIIAGVLIFKPQVSGFVTAGHDYSLDSFTECLAESNAVMYGAYWCPHCTTQKEMFGDSISGVLYVECDSKGKNTKPELCRQNNIQSYPSWIIDGRTYSGVQSLQTLSDITGCSLE
ncbi:MAG: hypothetical protein QGI80_00965 [archaeon]|jgi:glutaredoxin|nr:hypothetical protein [Euryarchaeota archaeon]MDP7260517.1 hypothetical protein [archaeon]HIK01182.1 hypothetical protein [Candidatus Undinarchaeales archaeon ERR594346 U_76725]|tara:strand:+ start:21474 stop:21860 length:387 start_codon:yes stop_codon:yes gene_type:complete